MEWTSVFFLSVLTLAAAAYAQYRLPFLTGNRKQAWWARGVLMMTGIAFGLLAVRQIGSTESHLMQLLIFLAAWGLVHVLAAMILLKPQQRNNPGHSK
jgi:hypothetical protein